MKNISRLVILSMLYMPTNAFAGEIIRIKKNKDTNRNRYEYSVRYIEAGSSSLKAKILSRKYDKKTTRAERSEDGLQVTMIKTKR